MALYPAASFEAKINQAIDDTVLLHRMVQGAITDPDIVTEGGTVQNIAKILRAVALQVMMTKRSIAFVRSARRLLEDMDVLERQMRVILSPASGFSDPADQTDRTIIIDAAGTLAAGTVTMPTNPLPGDRITISSVSQITAFTAAASPGQTVKNGAVLLAAGVPIHFEYHGDSSTWYRT